MAKQPTRTQIEQSMVDDLIGAFVYVVTNEPTTPVDFAHAHTDNSVNSRYAREVFGVLGSASLIEQIDAHDGDGWVLTQETQAAENPNAALDAWLAEQGLNATPPPAGAKSAPMQPKEPREGNSCYCGCNVKTSSHKSFYLPGHDARHAGMVGKAIAEARLDMKADPETVKDNVRALCDELPSEKLTLKAQNIGNRLFSVEMEKRAKIEEAAKPLEKPAEYVGEGTIRVGKNEYAAERGDDGKITYYVGDEQKTASITASKTFLPAE